MKAMLKAARKAILILMFTTNPEISIFRIGKKNGYYYRSKEEVNINSTANFESKYKAFYSISVRCEEPTRFIIWSNILYSSLEENRTLIYCS